MIDKPAGLLSVPAHPGAGEEDSVLGRAAQGKEAAGSGPAGVGRPRAPAGPRLVGGPRLRPDPGGPGRACSPSSTITASTGDTWPSSRGTREGPGPDRRPDRRRLRWPPPGGSTGRAAKAGPDPLRGARAVPGRGPARGRRSRPEGSTRSALHLAYLGLSVLGDKVYRSARTPAGTDPGAPADAARRAAGLRPSHHGQARPGPEPAARRLPRRARGLASPALRGPRATPKKKR